MEDVTGPASTQGCWEGGKDKLVMTGSPPWQGSQTEGSTDLYVDCSGEGNHRKANICNKVSYWKVRDKKGSFFAFF